MSSSMSPDQINPGDLLVSRGSWVYMTNAYVQPVWLPRHSIVFVIRKTEWHANKYECLITTEAEKMILTDLGGYDLCLFERLR